METKVFNLKRAVLTSLAQAGVSHDHRFQSWVKWVDKVNPQGQNGYAFQGGFIKDGTVEIELGRPRVMLAYTATGSRKYPAELCTVVVFRADGELEVTDIHTSSTEKGWALRIRDEVKALVDELAGRPAPITQAEIEAYLRVSLVMQDKGLQVVDHDPKRGVVEVRKSDGSRAWMDVGQAIQLIMEVCNG